MSLVDKLVRELQGDGYPDIEGTENSSEIIFNVDLEDKYANDFIDDLEYALLFFGYPIIEFDGVEINRIGKARYDGDLDFLSNYEVILYKDLY